jgi:hypothetical protein
MMELDWGVANSTGGRQQNERQLLHRSFRLDARQQRAKVAMIAAQLLPIYP